MTKEILGRALTSERSVTTRAVALEEPDFIMAAPMQKQGSITQKANMAIAID